MGAGVHDYDAVVVGSGAGGLAAALALARAGRRVAVYERHVRAGGWSQSFTLRGFRFSPGVHYVGALGPGGTLRRAYEGLGVAGDLVFLELDPDGYDRVFVGDERFDIPKGRERFAARLRDRFPAERAGIERYFDLVGRMIDELGWAAPVRSLHDAALLPARMPTVLQHGLRSLGHLLDGCTRDPLLRAILSIQAGDHAMAPSRAPAALHAGLQGYYLDGACYPRGGAQVIPETLVRHVRRHGGEVHLATEVAAILVEGGAVQGVRLADGRQVRADVVVSNADPGVTWGRLVAPEHVPWRLRHRVARTHWSASALSLFLAVDMDLRAAGLDSGNVWFSRTPDVDAAWGFAARRVLTGDEEIPSLFLNATTLKDPSLRSDGLHTVEAVALASMDAFAPWQDLAPGARPQAYRDLKARLTERMLDAVERVVPGLRPRTVLRSLGTPLANARFLGATRGAIYGTEKTLRNLGPLSFRTGTPIRGLFQCGASILAPGINGVTQSGLDAAAAALGCVRDDLLAASGPSLTILPAEDPGAWPEALRPAR